MPKPNKIVEDLINEGNSYSFENNKKYSHGECYSQATPEFMSWVSKVDDYISCNYNEKSGPVKLLNSLDRRKFTGYYKNEFETESTKVKAAIDSCRHLMPNIIKSDNYILALTKNPAFWTVLVVVIGGAYKFGYDNGVSKFDKEKIELNSENIIQREKINLLEKKLRLKNPLILKTK